MIPAREVAKRFLITAFLFLLPFSVLVWLNDQIISDKRGQLVEENTEQLNQIVAHFARLAQPLSYFGLSVARIKSALVWGEDPAQFFLKLPSDTVKLYSFDGRGKRTQYPGFEKDLKNISEQCLELIRKTARQKVLQLTLNERNLAESFFGGSNVIETLARKPGRLHNLEFFGLPRTVGIFPFKDRNRKLGFLLVFIDNLKVSLFELAKQALHKIKKLAGQGFDFGFVDLGNNFPDQILGMDRIPGVIRQQLNSVSNEPLIRDGKNIWGLSILNRKFLLFGRCSAIPPLESFFQRQKSFTFAGVASLVFIFFLLAFSIKHGISVRIQVMLLFSLAGAGSILTLLGFSSAYIETRKKTLLRERFAQTREVLEKIDNSFLFHKDGLAQKYQVLCEKVGTEIEVFSQLQKTRAGPTSVALGLLKELPKSLSIMIFDDKGKIVWRRATEADSALVTLFGKDHLSAASRIVTLTMALFNAVIKEGTTARILSDSMESPYTKSASEKILANLGTIYNIAFGKGKFALFGNFFLGDGGFPKGAIWITHAENMVEESFLETVQKRHHEYVFSPWFQNDENGSYALRLIPLKKVSVQLPDHKLGRRNDRL